MQCSDVFVEMSLTKGTGVMHLPKKCDPEQWRRMQYNNVNIEEV